MCAQQCGSISRGCARQNTRFTLLSDPQHHRATRLESRNRIASDNGRESVRRMDDLLQIHTAPVADSAFRKKNAKADRAQGDRRPRNPPEYRPGDRSGIRRAHMWHELPAHGGNSDQNSGGRVQPRTVTGSFAGVRSMLTKVPKAFEKRYQEN